MLSAALGALAILVVNSEARQHLMQAPDAIALLGAVAQLPQEALTCCEETHNGITSKQQQQPDAGDGAQGAAAAEATTITSEGAVQVQPANQSSSAQSSSVQSDGPSPPQEQQVSLTPPDASDGVSGVGEPGADAVSTSTLPQDIVHYDPEMCIPADYGSTQNQPPNQVR